MNKVFLVGVITKDPELKSSSSGSLCGFSIAVNRPFAKEGSVDVDYINCVAFGKQAENLAQYTHKGDLIGVDGRLQQRQYTTNNVTVTTYDVVCSTIEFIRKKQGTSSANQASFNQTYGSMNNQPAQQNDFNYGGSMQNNDYQPTEVNNFGGNQSSFVTEQPKQEESQPISQVEPNNSKNEEYVNSIDDDFGDDLPF